MHYAIETMINSANTNLKYEPQVSLISVPTLPEPQALTLSLIVLTNCSLSLKTSCDVDDSIVPVTGFVPQRVQPRREFWRSR